MVGISTIASANLLTNPGFETGSNIPWVGIGYHAFSVNPGAKYAGTYGLEMILSTSGDGWGGQYQNKPASEGDIFTFSAMSNTLNLNSYANSTLQIAYFDVSDPGYSATPIAAYNTASVTGLDWTELSITSYPAPAGTQAVRFVLVSYADPASGSGSSYFDDANATAIPEPSTMLLLGTGLFGLALPLLRRKK